MERNGLASFFSVLLGLFLYCSACTSDDGGRPPDLTPLNDQVAFVGQEFTLEVNATDPDGDTVTFGFKGCRVSEGGCSDHDIGGRSDFRQAGKLAVFRWTPIASDVGIYSFDFTASDGKHEAKENIQIEVKIQAGSSSSPIFRKPLGTGTTLDLTKKKCVEVEVEVEDTDSPGVTISQEQPLIDGASFEQQGGLNGKWTWCPTQAQISAGDRYALRLEADDGDNPPTVKNYLIVLRKAQKSDCPGEAPVIEHTVESKINSIVGLTIDVRVTDDVGIKYEPLLYYSFEPPSDPPDLAEMIQVTMVAITGTMQDGVWAADVPNPVATKPAGSTANVYYLVTAQDNDDKDGDCNHISQVPATGTYKVEVTNPGGSGGLGLCKSCSADVQCGGAKDLCALMGTAGMSYCFRSCSGDADCPETGYFCSSTITSVNGVKGRQCIPESGSCTTGGSTTTCKDDKWEPNDTINQAVNLPGLKEGLHSDLVSCPGSIAANEDWYPIDVYKDGTIAILLDGGKKSDLDIGLYDDGGYLIAKSENVGSEEWIDICVPKGAYFLRVHSWQNFENSYSIMYEFTPESCGTCIDDQYEPDNNATEARNAYFTDSDPYKSMGNMICGWNEDWFEAYMFKDETLYSTIKFKQQSSKQDLDIVLYKGTTLLTPCNETSSSGCDANNGQSGTSNERLVWPITAEGKYYVVVRGFNGSENAYDICIGLKSQHCPAL